MTHRFAARMKTLKPARRTGLVRKVGPARIEASGPLANVGELCEITHQGAKVLAEIAAVEPDRVLLAPFDSAAAISPGAIVTALRSENLAPVGDTFAGRAIDAMGAAIDGRAMPTARAWGSLLGEVPTPMERASADTALATGIRALDGLLSIGRGQRIGIFSASGVGKTTLITQLAAQVEAERCIICLVGERGREVESIWQTLSASREPERYTCVAATSDLSAPMRVRAVNQALALAEYWRERGEHVLIIIDSVTRLAMALREIGLSAGAPPTLRAYTPNVFAALPRVVERCGAVKGKGAITAIMTVLSETDDVDDPIVEVMKSLLDGHIILSRALAEQSVFPAIDPTRSVSRQSERLMKGSHGAAARRAIALLSTYEEARVMIESGVYKSGANAKLDEAILLREGLMQFLRQSSTEKSTLNDTIAWLQDVTRPRTHHA